MFKEAIQAIEGVEIFPIVSLLMFIGLFVGVVIYTMRLSRSEVDHASRLPLEDRTDLDRAGASADSRTGDH